MARKKRTRTPFSLERLKKAEHTVMLFAVVFVLVFVGVSFLFGIDDILSKFALLDPLMWVVLLALSLVNYVCRGMKWHIFGNRLKLGVPLKRMAVYYFGGMAMTVTPGKVGTALRLWFMNKGHNISYTKGLPLMIMDPITDLAALFIMCLAGLAAFGGGHTASLLVFGAILGGLMLLFAYPQLLLQLTKTIYLVFGRKKPRLYVRVMKIMRQLTQLVNFKTFMGTVGFSIIGWLGSVFAFWWVLQQMGAEITLLQAMFVFSFATILGGATMAPGGLGGTEASMVLSLLALGVDQDVAIAATMVIRLTLLWFGVFIGFLFIPLGMKLVKQTQPLTA